MTSKQKRNVIIGGVLLVCIVFFHHTAPDNTTHRPNQCQTVVYDPTTAQEVVVTHTEPGGDCR